MPREQIWQLHTRIDPAEAEPLLRECLDVRQKKLPDDWLTFNTQSLLGGSLFAQKNMLKPNLCYSPATKA